MRYCCAKCEKGVVEERKEMITIHVICVSDIRERCQGTNIELCRAKGTTKL